MARRIAPDAPESASLRAGKQVVARLGSLIAARRSFVHETTLSSHQSLQVMRQARAASYHIGLIFVVLHNVELNILRVRERVRMGGHSIPEQDIRRRYSRAIANLPVAMGIADQTAVYDNSSVSHVKLIEISGGNIVFNGLDKTNFTHREISGAIGTALSLTPDMVFETRPKSQN